MRANTVLVAGLLDQFIQLGVLFLIELLLERLERFTILHLVDLVLRRNRHRLPTHVLKAFVFLNDPLATDVLVFAFLGNLSHVFFEEWAAFFDVDWPATFILTVIVNFEHDFSQQTLTFRMAWFCPPLFWMGSLLGHCLLHLLFELVVD
jgi:hypothetical protein